VGRIFETKENSMKWFGKWLLKLASEASQDERNERIYGTAITAGSSKLARGSDIEADEGLNIVVRKAMGGKIVTFRTYDHKTDRNNHKLYVIPDDHDFEKELGKLITLESMRL
jgi:hypothetical protein